MSRTPSTSSISRRQVAKGVAWSVPAVTVASAAPALAASGATSAALTGVTGYYPATTVTEGGVQHTSYNGGSVTPSASSRNPAPYMYADTGVALGSTTGQQVSMTISLVNILDAQGKGNDAKVVFVPGTYTYTDSSGVALTATSVCGAGCRSVTITWALSGIGTTAENPQQVPFRVGMADGTIIPAGDQVSTGFTAPVFGTGPNNVQPNNTMTFDAGTYSGTPTTPTP